VPSKISSFLLENEQTHSYLSHISLKPAHPHLPLLRHAKSDWFPWGGGVRTERRHSYSLTSPEAVPA